MIRTLTFTALFACLGTASYAQQSTVAQHPPSLHKITQCALAVDASRLQQWVLDYSNTSAEITELCQDKKYRDVETVARRVVHKYENDATARRFARCAFKNTNEVIRMIKNTTGWGHSHCSYVKKYALPRVESVPSAIDLPEAPKR